jgi:hypothetical protein
MNMNSARLRAATLLLPALSLCACASTPAVRTLASNTGVFVQSLNDGTAEFVDSQNWLNARNENRLARLDSYGERDRAQVRQQRLTWTDMGSRSRVATHDLATGVPANEIVAGMTVIERQPTRIENGTSAGYRTALTTLADVSTAPEPLSLFRELFEYAQQIQESYDTLREAAATAANSAANASAAIDPP